MIIFTDIDDTLMRTARKIKGDVSKLKVGAINHKGVPLSFCDSKREKLINELIDNSVSIPVTARSIASFKNLKIGFKNHAVLNFGATILDKNLELDMAWHNFILKNSQELNQEEIFKDIMSSLSALLQEFEIETKAPKENEISVYANFRLSALISEKLNHVKEKIVEILNEKNILEKFYFYQTDRDLALIPSFIKKENAVMFLMENYYSKEDLMVGLGDHKNDLSFMSLCDFIMFPTDSMLMKLISN